MEGADGSDEVLLSVPEPDSVKKGRVELGTGVAAAPIAGSSDVE